MEQNKIRIGQVWLCRKQTLRAVVKVVTDREFCVAFYAPGAGERLPVGNSWYDRPISLVPNERGEYLVQASNDHDLCHLLWDPSGSPAN